MRKNLVVDGSGVIDFQEVPVTGSYTVIFKADTTLDYDYTLDIWNDGTKIDKIGSYPIIKEDNTLNLVLNCIEMSLNIGQNYYEILENEEKRVFRGFINIVP